MSSQLDHGWVSLRHTKQMGEGRETTNRSYCMRGARRKAQKNLEFKLQYLHHVETLSRGEAGPRGLSELRSRNASSLSSRGKKKYNSKLQSCSLIKRRGGVYIAHAHGGAPIKAIRPCGTFWLRTNRLPRPHRMHHVLWDVRT